MILERTLSNGLELVICPTSSPVASVHVWVDVGSVDEKPNEAGYCHFLEHMLFKGTKTRTTAQIAGQIEGSGGEMNAFTSFEYTAYHITLSNQKWKLAHDILADMVLGSVFKREEFDPEKEVILEEIKRGQDSPERQLYQGVYSMLWGKEGYGRPVIGFPKTVSACTSGGLKKFWEKWYAPSLMTVVVCGDVDPEEVEKVVTKTWGSVKKKALRPRRRETDFHMRLATSAAGAKAAASKPFPLNTVRWAGAVPAVSISSKELPALDLAISILGQGESSRLHQRLFREEQAVTSIGAGVWAPLAEGMVAFDAEVPLEKQGRFRELLREEVERFCKEGPTAEELEKAKVSVESERIYGSQSMESLAHRLGFLKTAVGRTQFDLEYLTQVRECSAADVREALINVFEKGAWREFTLYPKDLKEPGFWLSAYPPVQKETKAKPAAAKTAKKKVPAHAGHYVTLNNGIELALFPREEVPVVNMQASMLGGLRAETKESAGLGALTADVWDKGPQGWTAERMAQFLDSRASHLGAFSGKNSFGLSSSTLTKYLDDILGLFSDVLVNPAFEEKEVERARMVHLEELKTFDDSPGRLVDKLFCEGLFQDHPYSRPVAGRPEVVERLRVNDVRNHFRNLSNDSRVVISVAGKFNPEKIIKHFEKVWRKPAVQSQLSDAVKYEAPKAPRIVEVQKGREQSHLIYGFPGLKIGDKDRVNLRVLTTVLGGQSGRLFRELRDKQGLCYVVAPLSFEGIEPGYVGVYMGCDPNKREHALEGIRLELQRLVEKPITPAELQRAKEFVLGRHHMDMQLNSAIASTSSLNALYGLGYDNHLKLGDDLKKVSAAALQKLAQRLFTTPSVTAVVI